MATFNLRHLTQNAFRTLGLRADATQLEIDGAARQMRIWGDPALIPATENDAPWLGPVFRGANDIEGAVSRLAQPESRVDERLWWFCNLPPSDETMKPGDAAANVSAVHDATLMRMCRLLFDGVSGRSLEQWRPIIKEFAELADSEEYRRWLAGAEQAGDFDKKASEEEVGAAQAQMPALVATALADSLESLATAPDFEKARWIVHLLMLGDGSTPGVDGPAPSELPREIPASEAAPVAMILNRMEDSVMRECRECSEELDTAWKTLKVAVMRSACDRALSRFRWVTVQLIEEVVKASAGDSARQDRVKAVGAQTLLNTAQAFSAISDYVNAEAALSLAMKYATGTAAETAVSRELQRIAPEARRQEVRRVWTERGRNAVTVVLIVFFIILAWQRFIMIGNHR